MSVLRCVVKREAFHCSDFNFTCVPVIEVSNAVVSLANGAERLAWCLNALCSECMTQILCEILRHFPQMLSSSILKAYSVQFPDLTFPDLLSSCKAPTKVSCSPTLH